MTLLCGWLSADAGADGGRVVAAMGRALRVNPRQAWAQWSLPGLSVGLLDLPTEEAGQDTYAPAATPDGRHHLWLFGEAFAGGGLIDVVDPDHTRTLEFRGSLLSRLLQRGIDAIRELDGEYSIALWDSRDRILTLINDRFGGLPLYWARSSEGFAFAGGVRGVLMAPGIAAEPDPEALREAVTFGGFRLADRTNVASVKMAPGASIIRVRDGRPDFRRYWRWRDVTNQPVRPIDTLIDQVHERWGRAVHCRLLGAKHPGQTLSGGLDSRAILAEAAPRVPRWTAITYGLPDCDDARYAARAAKAAGAEWVFHPLYSGHNPDWLDRRTGHIQETDGLINLVDLMHLEALPLHAQLLDATLCGYVGDAVSGPTFNEVSTAADVLAALPFYGTRLGMGWEAALQRAGALVADLGGAPARFALFEHKLPQSTNRWSAAWRPWLRVRKPFVDYAFFDFCQGLPPHVRGEQKLHERWLRSRYPSCFDSIPNHKTGTPVLTPGWRVQAARARRLAWRTVQPGLARLGLPARPRIRNYHDDETFWRTEDVRVRFEALILRPGSLCSEILGRPATAAVLADWFEGAAAPAQVIGGLYVFEAYHRDLQDHLRAARRPT